MLTDFPKSFRTPWKQVPLIFSIRLLLHVSWVNSMKNVLNKVLSEIFSDNKRLSRDDFFFPSRILIWLKTYGNHRLRGFGGRG